MQEIANILKISKLNGVNHFQFGYVCHFDVCHKKHRAQHFHMQFNI